MQVRVDKAFLDSEAWETAVQDARVLAETDYDLSIHRVRNLATIRRFLEMDGVQEIYLDTDDLEAIGMKARLPVLTISWSMR